MFLETLGVPPNAPPQGNLGMEPKALDGLQVPITAVLYAAEKRWKILVLVQPLFIKEN